jgi:capsule biosynthesis phosphatase
MNVIIPIGGLGERFKNEGYNVPKTLVKFNGKYMIEWLLHSLRLTRFDTLIIPYNKQLDKYGFKDIVKQSCHRYQDVIFVPISFQTKNVIETLNQAILYLNNSGRAGNVDLFSKPTISVDCDTFYSLPDSEDFYKENLLQVVKDYSYSANIILYKHDKNIQPIYSYILINDQQKVTQIKEKNKISDNACIGAYVFVNLNELEKYCNELLLTPRDKEIYISDIYDLMIRDNKNVYGLQYEHVYCTGTPLQLKILSSIVPSKPLRFCFDLDNTLVSPPFSPGDYSTVSPNHKNIKYLQYLKKKGHTIIINTARRMRTHGGNCGKLMADIGKLTFDTLEQFNIPFDEIYFGKPDADFYIDDKAVNCITEDLEKCTGVYNLECESRSFNSIKLDGDGNIVKTSTDPKINGEIHWYRNIPPEISDLFPVFYSSYKNSYTIENIQGIPLSHIYTDGGFNSQILKNILYALNRIHNSNSPASEPSEQKIDMYSLYCDKLKDRYKNNESFYYTLISKDTVGTLEIYDWLCSKYTEYKKYNFGVYGVIHGDAVFSNILLDDKSQLKFIDMRGINNYTPTIYGDIFYDYAKIYQSICGYDYILLGKNIDYKNCEQYKDEFKKYFIEKFGKDKFKYLQYLTVGLFFTLLPLHANENDDTLRELYYRCSEIYKEVKEPVENL